MRRFLSWLALPFRIGWRNFAGLLLTFLCIVSAGIMSAQDTLRGYPPMLQWNGTSLVSPVSILLPDGAVAAPALAFASDTDTGMYRTAVGQIAFTYAGANQLRIGFGAGEIDFDVRPQPYGPDVLTLGYTTLTWQGLYATRFVQGSKSKTLVDAAAAASFARIAVPTNGYIGGRVIWTVNSTDGVDRLTSTGESWFAGSDKAGTPLCTTPLTAGMTPITSYQRANTLVCTLSAAVSGTNCDLQVTCTDNKAGDQTPIFEWRLDMPSIATVTPQ